MKLRSLPVDNCHFLWLGRIVMLKPLTIMNKQARLTGKVIVLISGALILGAFAVFIPAAHASNVIVSGAISTNTTWISSNVYIVQGSVTVASGVTLTIASGTIVKLDTSPAYMEVQGTLQVNGDASSPVYFTSLNDNIGGAATSSTGSPVKGDWCDIRVDSGAMVNMTSAVVRYGGCILDNLKTNIYTTGGTTTLTNSEIASSTNYGIRFTGGTISIGSSTIHDNGVYGIYESSASGNITVTTSTFSGNGSAAGYIDYSSSIHFTNGNNSASGTNAGFIADGSISTSTTWYADPNAPYVITGTLTVSSGKTLTVNHGAVVKLSGGDINISGVLNVQGTSGDKVYFTSINDNSIGNITSGRSTSTPSRGDWPYIQISIGASSTIDNAVIEYGGFFSTKGELYLSGGNLTLTNSQVASSSFDGLNILGGVIDISSTTINGSAQYGVLASGSGTLNMATDTFYGNTGGSASLDVSGGIQFNPSNASSSDSSDRGFIMNGPLATDTIWADGGIPYIIMGTITVSSGTTLTIHPAIIKFSPGGLLDVVNHGTLDVDGDIDPVTEKEFVRFTALTDDSLGGDTNANGTSTASPGDSGFIRIGTGASSTFIKADVLYGGAALDNYSSIYQLGGQLTFSSSTIASSSNYGLQIGGGTSTITGSQFLNNSYGIYMTAGSMTTNASSVFAGNTEAVYNGSAVTSTAVAHNDYWNAYSGPFNFNYNPSGAGDSISDYVDFNPFITNNVGRPHYLEGSSSVYGSSTIRWNGTTTYSVAWANAISTWDALGIINITAATSTADLAVSDVDKNDVSWIGQYIPTSAIQFNQFYLKDDSVDQIQNTATHELGHALGLNHSYITNVMNTFQTFQTTLGSQDISDYNFLW